MPETTRVEPMSQLETPQNSPELVPLTALQTGECLISGVGASVGVQSRSGVELDILPPFYFLVCGHGSISGI